MEARGGGKDNHATSGLKFKVLIDFISIGCSVLLSDVDVLWLQNPFPRGLYRDADVEGMSDGWDHPTVFGHNAGDGSFRMHARNSGMFFLQATRESLAMVQRLARRMETEGTWDQSAFNQEQFKPAFGDHLAVRERRPSLTQPQPQPQPPPSPASGSWSGPLSDADASSAPGRWASRAASCCL